jgi:hypothetical protein
MKFVSVFLFLTAMALSWKIMDLEPAIAVETHSQIQLELEKVIRTTIEKQRAGAQNIYFERMWTENLGPTRVVAHFEYSFVEPSAEDELIQQTVSGTAFLNREGSANPDEDAWALDQVNITDTKMVFGEGIVITPSGKEEAK